MTISRPTTSEAADLRARITHDAAALDVAALRQLAVHARRLGEPARPGAHAAAVELLRYHARDLRTWTGGQPDERLRWLAEADALDAAADALDGARLADDTTLKDHLLAQQRDNIDAAYRNLRRLLTEYAAAEELVWRAVIQRDEACAHAGRLADDFRVLREDFDARGVAARALLRALPRCAQLHDDFAGCDRPAARRCSHGDHGCDEDGHCCRTARDLPWGPAVRALVAKLPPAAPSAAPVAPEPAESAAALADPNGGLMDDPHCPRCLGPLACHGALPARCPACGAALVIKGSWGGALVVGAAGSNGLDNGAPTTTATGETAAPAQGPNGGDEGATATTATTALPPVPGYGWGEVYGAAGRATSPTTLPADVFGTPVDLGPPVYCGDPTWERLRRTAGLGMPTPAQVAGEREAAERCEDARQGLPLPAGRAFTTADAPEAVQGAAEPAAADRREAPPPSRQDAPCGPRATGDGAEGAAPSPCTWGAGGCQGEAAWLVTHRGRGQERREPMCASCAGIFDAALSGRQTGYSPTFVRRGPVESCQAARGLCPPFALCPVIPAAAR